MTMPITWLRWLVTARRHPSALLLVVQLAGVLLYPTMEDTDLGRVLFGVFGMLVLALALWVVNRSPSINWIAWCLAVPAVLLSLLSIGASFEGTKAIKKLGPTLAAAFIKTVGLAAVFLPCAVAMGFRNEELVALLIMLGSPTTPSAYVMSRNMGHEGVLTSSCIALTTLLSALTLTGWIFVLRSGGYL